MKVIDNIKMVKVYPNIEYKPKEDCIWSDYYNEYILIEESCTCINGHLILLEDDSFVWIEEEGGMCFVDDAWISDISGNYYSNNTYAVWDYGGCVEAPQEEFVNDCNYEYIMLGSARDKWVHTNEITFCCDVEEDVLSDDAFYCEIDGEHYYNEDNMPTNSTAESICGYHSSPEADDLNSSKYNTKFSIGFEIEKTDFNGLDCEGDYIGEQELFKGYESDSSCGVEAITHILPLGNTNSKARKYVFGMIDSAEVIINSNTSYDCGGHITISIKGYSGWDVLEKFRTKMAIIYALYPARLMKSYCEKNKKLERDNNRKYSPVNVMSNRIEVRLPSAVKNTTQLKLRYDLMYKLLYYSIHGEKMSFSDILDKVQPIFRKMYKNDVKKVKRVNSLAHDFRMYLLNEEVAEDIKRYI